MRRAVPCLGASTRALGRRPPAPLRPRFFSVKPPPPVDKPVTTGGVGIIAGVFGSMVGMGGAFVSLPLLTGVLKLSQHHAHGTSLASVMSTGAAGALGFASAGQVDWVAALSLAAAGVVTARLGASVTSRLSGPALRKSLGIFQVCIAPTVPLCGWLRMKKDEQQLAREGARGHAEPGAGAGAGAGGFEAGSGSRAADSADQSKVDVLEALRFAVIGGASGFLAGIFGVGGGAIMVPALVITTPDMSYTTALGTSLAAMVLPAMSGVAKHHAARNVVWRVAAPLAAGTALGSFFGAQLAVLLPEREMRFAFCAVMLTLGGRTLMTKA